MTVVNKPLRLPRVVLGRSWGLLWHAHICEGGEVMATVVSWSEKRARRRSFELMHKLSIG